MPVTIRLRRVGRKKQPSYRVVVTDSSRPRDGAYLETIGFYNPRREPAELRLDLDKVEAWVGQGAELSTTVASLVRKAKKGGDRKVGYTARGAEPQAAAPAVPEQPAPKPAPKKAEEPTAQAVAEAVSEPSPDTPEEPAVGSTDEEPAAE